MVRIVVSYDDHPTDLVNDVVREVSRQLSRRYGGSTTHPAGTGVWIDSDGNRHEDKSIVIESACIADDFDPRLLENMQRLIAGALDQEAVMAYTEQVNVHMYEGES